ncbi:hypothetical protein EGW08_022216 [Elysia chlorotica]|uniref:7TM GPCR serpentine receptor class x (Srx) domain-containing protein n=1 Tax=Elysia chlorotica TaxID=188477 RepID=A0A433SLJ4_ELYCH|nr:hypothetical protein EGW08_022216 [Elysia chlorotica]
MLSRDTLVSPGLVHYVSLLWSQDMMYLVSNWITTFISLERCVCVIWPFKVKSLFTRTRCIVVLVIIFIVHVASYVPIFASHRLDIVKVKAEHHDLDSQSDARGGVAGIVGFYSQTTSPGLYPPSGNFIFHSDRDYDDSRRTTTLSDISWASSTQTSSNMFDVVEGTSVFHAMEEEYLKVRYARPGLDLDSSVGGNKSKLDLDLGVTNDKNAVRTSTRPMNEDIDVYLDTAGDKDLSKTSETPGIDEYLDLDAEPDQTGKESEAGSKKVMMLTFSKNRALIHHTVDIINGAVLPVVQQALVIASAGGLAYGLKAVSKVRTDARAQREDPGKTKTAILKDNGGGGRGGAKPAQKSGLSQKEMRLVKVVAFLALILTICNIPR